MTTNEEIRQRILQSGQKATPAVPSKVAVQPKPAEKKGGNLLTPILGFFILLMSVMTIGGMIWKNQNKIGKTETPVAERIVVDRPVDPAYATKADLDAAMASLDRKVSGMDEKLAAWSHRVWLMGVAHNENVNLKISQDKYDPGYIYFDENWKLSHMPKTFEMSDDMRQKLQKDVR